METVEHSPEQHPPRQPGSERPISLRHGIYLVAQDALSTFFLFSPQTKFTVTRSGSTRSVHSFQNTSSDSKPSTYLIPKSSIPDISVKMKSFTFATFVATAAAVPSGWSDWASTTTTTTTPVKVTSKTTTTPAYDPSHTWADWTTTTTTTTPVKATTTSYDPWVDWSATTTTTTPVKATTTSYDPSWADWESASYTTTVVTAIETYCATPTVFTHAGKTYSCSSSTVTVTDCPCTVTVPVSTKTSSSCA